MKFGAKLGKAIRELVTIVHPSTFLRWLRDDARKSKRPKAPKRGRPKTHEEIRQLILLLARENNSWGYTRIPGELKKLGIEFLSRNTIKNILKEHGLDPAPQHGEGTWDNFINRRPPCGSVISSPCGHLRSQAGSDST